MELSILNSLLHGNLKPWNLDTSDKKPFIECVKLANAISQDSKSNLYERSRALLTSFPELQKKLKETKPLKDGPIQMPLFKIEKPEHNDVFTRFYALLIDNEALRFANLLSAEVSKKSAEVDKVYAIKQALRSIKTLAQQSAREIKEIGSDSISDAQNKLTNFALSYLKQSMIALYFDVQEQYKSHLKTVFTEEEFRAEIFDEPRSGTDQLKPSKAYFEIQIQNLLTDGSYSETSAKELLSKMQSLQTLQSLQTALENLIFLHSLSAEKIPTTISELSEPAFVKQQLSFAKKAFTSEINNHSYGFQRLELVESYFDSFDYVDTTYSDKNSIPHSLIKWLEQQKSVYSINASTVFAIEADSSQILNKKKKPVAKKDKPTLESNKQFALEHLNFFSGFNIKQEKIMSDADYKRLLSYTYHLIETGSLPKDFKPILQIGISTQHIRYTYYLIHKGLYGTHEIKTEWIDFLKKVFKQFENTEWQTIKTKFSVKPSSYDADLNSMKR